jgi:P63C domain
MTEDVPSGKARGGHARAEALPPETRKEIAKKAARARWDDPVATHIGELKIGDLILPCAVLPDGTRVISQGGIATAFGPVTGGWQMRKRASDEDVGDLPPFLVAASLKDHISNDLRTMVSSPRRYRDPRGGPIRLGLEASLLPKVCEVWLRARDAEDLTKIQRPVAERADVLMRGLAHTGIIALIDEATGYQRDRATDALAKILEAFIAKELQPYVTTFPSGYYEEMFRLRGLEYPTGSVKRPQYFGMLTNDIVYKRLAPGVLEELKRVTPKLESGRHKDKLFQRLTNNIGYPKLREHLGSIVAIMRLSNGWHDFMDKLERLHPRYGETIPLPLNYEKDNDDGKGL